MQNKTIILDIGRDSNCDYTIKGSRVSRLHCKLIIENNNYYIQDNNSTNGTYINGSRFFGKHKLSIADILTINNGVVPWRKYVIRHIKNNN